MVPKDMLEDTKQATYQQPEVYTLTSILLMLGLKPLNCMGYLGNWVSGISHFLLAAAGLAVAMEMKRKTIVSVK